jgi:hypothetical protein
VARQQTLLVVALLLVLLNLSLFSFLLHKPAPTGRAQNTGIASFCINTAPEFNISCSTTLGQGTAYYCQLEVIDPDVGTDLVFVQMPVGEQVFNLSVTGAINFTPNQSHVGNHTTYLLVNDSSGCANGVVNTSFNFSVDNINDPPYLSRTIPDQGFLANTTLAAFFLTDYFTDPDGDEMNFTATIPSGFQLAILSTSQVLLSSSTCDPDGELVTFTATDPFNESGDSNAVTITVTCPTSSGGGGGSSGGGGSGGGGGSFCTDPDWTCDEWTPCTPTNVEYQHCYDKNSCRTEQYLKRQCTYSGPAPVCAENWLCEEWGNCFTNGTQQRTCRDLKLCSSMIVRPPLEQRCTYEPTCNDGLQNGDETGLDCGGICGACALVQHPDLLGAAPLLNPWLLLMIILSLLLIGGVLRYYKAELRQGIAILGFLLSHREHKDILLGAVERKSFFERIREQEATPNLDGAADLIRSYISEALVLPVEALPEEVEARCKQLQLRPQTTLLMRHLLNRSESLEQPQVALVLEELRTAVCLTSEFTKEELERPMDEVVINDKMSFYDEIIGRSINVMRAVQSDQLDAGQKEYLTLLQRYEALSVQEQESIYADVQLLFESLKFTGDITGVRIVDKSGLKAEM